MQLMIIGRFWWELRSIRTSSVEECRY